LRKLRFEESDFDTLIILDACRYDFYTKLRDADKAISPDSATPSSIPQMFPGDYPNTIYISGNPAVNSNGCEPLDEDISSRFRRIVDTWDHGWTKIEVEENRFLECLPPSEVVKDVEKHRNGNKIVSHFMQPHQPYIGETKLNFGISTDDSVEKVKKAYMDNLKLVLKHALDCVKGKTIITSDHGELLRREGGSHPPNKENPELREVPYEVIEV